MRLFVFNSIQKCILWNDRRLGKLHPNIHNFILVADDFVKFKNAKFNENCEMPVASPSSAVNFVTDTPTVTRRNYTLSGIPCKLKCFAQVHQIPRLGLKTKKHFWILNVIYTVYLKNIKA